MCFAATIPGRREHTLTVLQEFRPGLIEREPLGPGGRPGNHALRI